MNFKKMMMVGIFILVILTIGAVSAADDVISDELAADECLETGHLQEIEISGDAEEVIGSAQEDPIAGDDENWQVRCPGKIVNNTDEYEFSEINVQSDGNSEGTLEVYINGVKVDSDNYYYGYYSLSLVPYLDHYGDYTWKVDFAENGKPSSTIANGTFVFEAYKKTKPNIGINVPKRIITFDVMDADGNIEIYNNDDVEFRFLIDGKEVAHDKYMVDFNIGSLGLSYGKHMWEVRFDGDNHFLPYYENGTFIYSNVYIGVEERYFANEDWMNNIAIALEKNVGYVKVLIDGKQIFYGPFKVDADISDELMYVDLPNNLNYGMHTWKVVHEKSKGTATYSEEGKFDFSYEFRLQYNENFIYGVENSVILSLPSDLTGQVELIAGGKTYNANAQKTLEFNVDSLDLGEQTITVKVTSTNAEYPSKTDSFEVNVNAEIIAPERVDFDEDYIISLTLPSNATGRLVLSKDDIEVQSADLINGKATINLGKLELGLEQSISVAYVDGNYDVDSIYRDISSTPKVTVPQGMYVGETKYVKFELPKSADGILTVNLDGTKKFSGALKDGKAQVALAKLDHGTYSLEISYAGDSNIPSYSADFEFSVYKYTPNITYNIPAVIVVGQKTTITFNVPKDAEGEIEFGLNMDDMDYYTVSNGKATVTFTPKKTGTQKAYYSFSTFSDKYDDVDDKSITFTAVYKGKIEAGTFSMVYTEKPTFKVRVFDENNNPVSGKAVTFKVAGKTVSTTTDSKGYASFKPNYKPGSYSVVISSNGISVTKKLTVKHLVNLKDVYIIAKKTKKLVLTATLSKVNKKVLKNKKVTFKFNGKKYTAKTNSKGVAKVTIKNNVLKKLKVGKKVTYSAAYSKETVKKTTRVYSYLGVGGS